MPWEWILPNVLSDGLSGLAGVETTATSGLAGMADSGMESAAFAGFYERSARPLWAYLARVSGDGALADDLAQEAYVRFLCAAGAPTLERGEVECRRYLYRIASNLLRDHWRRPRPERMDEVPEEMFAVSAGAAQTDVEAMLGPAMEKMRPRDRQILWLAYAEGYSHKEIAEVTGLASASVRLLLFRARRKMAGLLRGTENDQVEALKAAPLRRLR